MPAYTFEALDAQGATQKGLIDADTAKAARSQLRARALVPLSVEPALNAPGESGGRGLNITLWGGHVFNATGLAVWGNAGPTVIHLEESSHPIHMNLRPGTVMALSTAMGRVFAAYLPAKRIERFIEESMHPHAFPHIIGNACRWLEMQPALQEVREHGMARAQGQPIAGVSAFAAPVFDHNGDIVMVISAIGPTGGFNPDWDGEIASVLREVAGSISAQLGFSASAPKN